MPTGRPALSQPHHTHRKSAQIKEHRCSCTPPFFWERRAIKYGIRTQVTSYLVVLLSQIKQNFCVLPTIIKDEHVSGKRSAAMRDAALYHVPHITCLAPLHKRWVCGEVTH